jgi:hypothetical protein
MLIDLYLYTILAAQCAIMEMILKYTFKKESENNYIFENCKVT